MKLALITGASSGLGQEITKELATKGYHTIGSARSLDKLKNLAQEVNGSYFQFYGDDLNSVFDLAEHTYNKFKEEEFEELLVIAAADRHEDSVIIENGKKRYSELSDFSKEYKDSSEKLAVLGPVVLYSALNSKIDKLDFVYVSSQAAKKEFWDSGNSVYGKNKRDAEKLFSSFDNVYSLRFGFIDTEMADKIIGQLEGVERFVHVNEDFNNPLKDKSELCLPVNLVARDISGFIENKENFKKVEKNIYEYTVSPSKELYYKYLVNT
ncbi:MAG: SDR family NAD(P)-dependent oxidoreductase [Candidatus Woesearchaeota archaeon]